MNVNMEIVVIKLPSKIGRKLSQDDLKYCILALANGDTLANLSTKVNMSGPAIGKHIDKIFKISFGFYDRTITLNRIKYAKKVIFKTIVKIEK